MRAVSSQVGAAATVKEGWSGVRRAAWTAPSADSTRTTTSVKVPDKSVDRDLLAGESARALNDELLQKGVAGALGARRRFVRARVRQTHIEPKPHVAARRHLEAHVVGLDAGLLDLQETRAQLVGQAGALHQDQERERIENADHGAASGFRRIAGKTTSYLARSWS